MNFNYVEITTCASVGFLERLYEFHPVARGLGVEGHCRLLMGDVLPRETENTVYRGLVYVLQVFLKDIPSLIIYLLLFIYLYRYLIAISKLRVRLGILIERQGTQARSRLRRLRLLGAAWSFF